MLQNITELLVSQKLDDLLKKEDCCKCPQCREDMLAYALNQLHTHYVSTNKGQLIEKARALSSEYDVEIVKALAMAMKVVTENPRH